MLKPGLVQVIEADDICCPRLFLNGYEKLWIHIQALFYICVNLGKSLNLPSSSFLQCKIRILLSTVVVE